MSDGSDEIGTISDYNSEEQTSRRYTYLLRKVEGVGVVIVRGEESGAKQVLDPRRDLHNSFGGFAWGYGGSGPQLLAASLLAHHRQEQDMFMYPQDRSGGLEKGSSYDEDFKAVLEQVVAPLPDDECEVTTEDLQRALGEEPS